MSEKGRVFKVSRYAIHDGPGIRTTVFLKGCPARCLWCCSPESQEFARQIAHNDTLCLGCGRCEAACTKHAVYRLERTVSFDAATCDFCGDCARVCPKEAMEIIGDDVTSRELFNLVRRDEPFWRRSGGGVTLSGGEVLSQANFAIDFLALCRSGGIHTAIETCLFADAHTLRTIADLSDFIQFDIKAITPSLHMNLTSLDNGQILDNAILLLQGKYDLIVRYPLVPGCNDFEEELDALGGFCAKNRPGATIELLPYHAMGMGRYAALGMEYTLHATRSPTVAEMARSAEILRRYSLNVICN